jgi:serine/threonine protein kinase
VRDGDDNLASNGNRLADLDAARQLLAENDEERAALAEASAATQRIGEYLLERKVGSGGAGSVYRARHAQTDRIVAVKLLTQRLGESAAAARAWRELQVLSQLRLVCLPRLLDYGEHDGRLYLVSEFIEGATLARYCDERNLDRRQRVELLAEVAEALHELHGYAVIHRDIKPDNIIVDGQGRPFIVDLGLASLLGDDSTRTITEEGVPIGSPAFMSPEQARGEMKALSALSDVYSLGATAYFVLTGDTPHDTRVSVHEAIRRVAQTPPRPPRELAPALPKALSAVLQKSVSPKPRDRYASAQAYAEDLRRWLRGDAVEATPPSAAQKFGRFVGRHPIFSTTAASAVLSLSVVVASLISIRWVNAQPWGVAIDPDGSAVRLKSFSGAVLFQWHLGEKGRAYLAEFVVDSPMAPESRLALLGLDGNCQREESGELFAASASDPGTILWRSGRFGETFPLPPGFEVRDDDVYTLRCAEIADVFPSRPGKEVVSLHLHPRRPFTALRVTDMAGAVLYQVWHRGHLSDVHWAAGSKLLLACGVSNDERLRRGDTRLQKGVYPTVVFGVTPKIGVAIDQLVDPFDTAAAQPTRLYCVLSPLVAAEELPGGAAELASAPHGLDRDDERIRLSLHTPDQQSSVHWYLNGQGAFIGGADPTAQYAADAGRPAAEILRWRGVGGHPRNRIETGPANAIVTGVRDDG